MANPFSKGWKYLMASFDAKIDENADPKVQIQQAIDAAKKQHAEITEQAAAIIGNKKQLEMKMNGLLKKQKDLTAKAQTAVQLADKATADGDMAKANEYNRSAESIASELVAVEQELSATKATYEQASQAAETAAQQQKQSEARLQEQLAEVRKLQAQADQAAMQEKSAQAIDSINSLGKDDNVPTLDGVREKIEQRYATALGQQELAESGATSRMAEIETSARDIAAASKLEEIRASMRAEAPAVKGGSASAPKGIDVADHGEAADSAKAADGADASQ